MWTDQLWWRTWSWNQLWALAPDPYPMRPSEKLTTLFEPTARRLGTEDAASGLMCAMAHIELALENQRAK